MRRFLQDKVGQKLGVVRAGMPREVYFDATLKQLLEGVAVFTDEQGRELAVPLDKILLIGPPADDSGHPVAGFCRPVT